MGGAQFPNVDFRRMGLWVVPRFLFRTYFTYLLKQWHLLEPIIVVNKGSAMGIVLAQKWCFRLHVFQLHVSEYHISVPNKH